MSTKALRNVIKRRVHKERSQPVERQRLGLLEKKKDYKLRAADHNRKIDTIDKLKRVAANRNPDEFATGMIGQTTKDGVHVLKRGTKRSFDDLKHMKAQDINYLTLKQQSETKTIDKLQSELHCLDDNDDETPAKRHNAHVIFLDEEKKVKEFDPVEHFDTAPEIIGRTFNRPRRATLEQEGAVSHDVDKRVAVKSAKAKAKKYSELAARIDRKEEIGKVLNKLQTQKNLQGKGRRKKIETLDKFGDVIADKTYFKWKQERKK